jgi:hypothetical protein
MMSEILMVLDIDAATGIAIEREMNADELSAREQILAEQSESDTQAASKATARASALAKLADLGLTAEEIAAL